MARRSTSSSAANPSGPFWNSDRRPSTAFRKHRIAGGAFGKPLRKVRAPVDLDGRPFRKSERPWMFMEGPSENTEAPGIMMEGHSENPKPRGSPWKVIPKIRKCRGSRWEGLPKIRTRQGRGGDWFSEPRSGNVFKRTPLAIALSANVHAPPQPRASPWDPAPTTFPSRSQSPERTPLDTAPRWQGSGRGVEDRPIRALGNRGVWTFTGPRVSPWAEEGRALGTQKGRMRRKVS